MSSILMLCGAAAAMTFMACTTFVSIKMRIPSTRERCAITCSVSALLSIPYLMGNDASACCSFLSWCVSCSVHVAVLVHAWLLYTREHTQEKTDPPCNIHSNQCAIEQRARDALDALAKHQTQVKLAFELHDQHMHMLGIDYSAPQKDANTRATKTARRRK